MAVLKRQSAFRKGQSIMEYSLLIGLVVAAFTVMSTFLKRSTQAMVKFSADMVGNQIEAEQIKDSSGAHLVNSHTAVAFEKEFLTDVKPDRVFYNTVKDETTIYTETLTNAGFTPADTVADDSLRKGRDKRRDIPGLVPP